MRIFITGGTGFLGKHVVKKLEDYGSVFAPSSKTVDFTNLQNTLQAIRAARPDVILHMAARCGGILANKNSPADFLRDNTQMGLNTYEAARILNINTVYSLGSICMYPKFCPVPFKETDIWNGAAEESNFPYGQAKRTLLMLSQTYRAQYGIMGAHLVPVNLFGEEDHFDPVNSHVIPALIRKFITAEKNNLPTVECWGTGEATREFLYVGDCADVISHAVLTKFNYEEPINLGVGQDISIKNLAALIKELTNYNGDVVFTGDVSDGQPKRMLDVSRAKEKLGWIAKTPLRDGLSKTIEWYRHQQ